MRARARRAARSAPLLPLQLPGSTDGRSQRACTAHSTESAPCLHAGYSYAAIGLLKDNLAGGVKKVTEAGKVRGCVQLSRGLALGYHSPS